MIHSILVVEDDELLRWTLNEQLRADGFEVLEAVDGLEGLEKLKNHSVSVVLLDLRMPKLDGLSMLRKIREAGDQTTVVVMTSSGGVDEAIEATHLGAEAWLSKPFEHKELQVVLQKALREKRLSEEVHYLRGRAREGYGEFIGASSSLIPMFELLQQLESVDAPTVLITGESGTGKDVIARSIYAKGVRKNRVFMEIDCASLTETLIESELFGHERGAFTDARMQKRGLLESAGNGVVFLDEIGEMTLGTQAKLLRALENRTFKRVGGLANLRLECSVIAATNRDLREEVRLGRFREDLFFRLHVLPIRIPPLRERKEDIPGLVAYFLDRFSKNFAKSVVSVSSAAMVALENYRWPGNVRELKNVLERMVILSKTNALGVEDLPVEIRYFALSSSESAACPFLLPAEGIDLEAVERGLLVQALERAQGQRSAAARLLGISRHALRYRMEKFGLEGGA